ncbi:metalloregulator ArsR/SmtB family transcription factor [Paralimibaculum aggregatum]|uniref:Metalloregulator ArsR/SmtB family transcription factor n=1 Tax=Paralimibaculum aggregatum TaxID=3036245 RepID=A0ABQ6LL72_9RHOB|nr:metalloregulator ArsR/SmtB family transcription factor [Limibaculum sp. NKW23]GMG81988.1 metalloregulator ArsR/SmtB family transcription factor [Limibaculum sp. NKW23]
MPLPSFDDNLSADELGRMMQNARHATDFLKALAHEGRLMILCYLASGERSVTELEQLLSQRQAAVSQQLARLRLEGLVENRREGKVIYYRLVDGRVRQMIELVYELFCQEEEEAGRPRPGRPGPPGRGD